MMILVEKIQPGYNNAYEIANFVIEKVDYSNI